MDTTEANNANMDISKNLDGTMQRVQAEMAGLHIDQIQAGQGGPVQSEPVHGTFAVPPATAQELEHQASLQSIQNGMAGLALANTDPAQAAAIHAASPALPTLTPHQRWLHYKAYGELPYRPRTPEWIETGTPLSEDSEFFVAGDDPMSEDPVPHLNPALSADELEFIEARARGVTWDRMLDVPEYRTPGM